MTGLGQQRLGLLDVQRIGLVLELADIRMLVDNLALHGKDFDAVLARIKEFDLPWVGNVIADFGLWQLMVYDPNGVLVELNFKAKDETGATPAIPADRQMGGTFDFDPTAYARFEEVA